MFSLMDTLAKAFLSYAHADNDRENGRILRLADHIRSEFELLTGSTIEIFTDSAEILWGQDFRRRLDEALQETTFFIPVLTPTYFMREECRKEMNRFVASAAALGLDELLLSLRYIPVPDLREDSVDDLKAVSAQMQFEAWDQLRLEDEQSTEHRRAVNKLAARLVQLTQNMEGGDGDGGEPPSSPGTALVAVASSAVHDGEEPRRPTIRIRTTDSAAEQNNVSADELTDEADGHNDDEGPDDDEPGLMDLVAEAQPAMDVWGATLKKLPAATVAFNEKFSVATQKMVATNALPNAFAVKVQIARELASDVEPELAEIEQLSKDYSIQLLKLDPSIKALFELAALSDDPEAHEAVTIITAAISKMVVAARAALEGTTSAADAARATAKLSKDLRPVMRRFETAMRNIGDGFTYIEAWETLAP
jgi:hypothetical protein